MYLFDLNQTRNSVYRKLLKLLNLELFWGLTRFTFVPKILGQLFRKNLFTQAVAEKIVGTKIRNQANWTGTKNVCASVQCLAAMARYIFLERRLVTRLCLHPIL